MLLIMTFVLVVSGFVTGERKKNNAGGSMKIYKVVNGKIEEFEARKESKVFLFLLKIRQSGIYGNSQNLSVTIKTRRSIGRS